MSGSSVEQGLIVPPTHSIITGVNDALELARHLLKSGMLPIAIKTPEAALVIILTGRELGIGPMMAFQKINVIQGKPTIAPELMLALARRQGLLEDLQIADDGTKCTVTIKRKGNSPVSVSFSMADAETQGLAGKDNWRRMPAIMRQWRAIAAGCRIVFSDVIGGLYTPEELGADVNEEGEVVTVVPTVVSEVPQPQVEAKPEPVKPDKTTPNTVDGNATTPAVWSNEVVEAVQKEFKIDAKPHTVKLLMLFPEMSKAPLKDLFTIIRMYRHYRHQKMEVAEAVTNAREEFQHPGQQTFPD